MIGNKTSTIANLMPIKKAESATPLESFTQWTELAMKKWESLFLILALLLELI
jgi:hypothetical protein